MKKLIYGIAIFGILTACNEGTKKTTIDNELSEEINPIENPNLFVGKHKTKAMRYFLNNFKCIYTKSL